MKKRLKEKKIYFPIFSSDFEGHDIYTKSQEITPPPPSKEWRIRKYSLVGLKDYYSYPFVGSEQNI